MARYSPGFSWALSILGSAAILRCPGPPSNPNGARGLPKVG